MSRLLRRVRSLMIALGVVLLGLFAVVLGALYLGQRSVVFPAPRPAIGFPGEGLGFHRVTEGGGAVLWYPAPRATGAAAANPAPTVIFFHGNGEQLTDTQDFGEALHQRGLGFLAIEYPGYGFSPGAPSESGLYAAAQAGVEWLRKQPSYEGGPLVLVGRSLGSGVATELARRGVGTRLILVAAYTSIPDVASGVLPWAPTSLLVRDRFDSVSKAPEISMPVLLVHGSEDEVIPYALGQRLSTRFPHGRLLTVPGAHHNDVLERFPAAFEAVAAFALEAGR